MSDKKSIHNASFNSHALLVFSALCMIGTSLYLTSHYFNTYYTVGFSGSGLCELNSFFSCDKVTNSGASNLFGVPISLFGILNGILILSGYIFTSRETEKSITSIILLNGVLCGTLFLYSLIALGGLCPFCAMYYAVSILALFVYYKNSTFEKPDIKSFLIIGLFFLTSSGVMYGFVQSKEQQQQDIANKESVAGQQMVEQYKGLDNLGTPEPESPFSLVRATKNFSDSPIQLVIFSDFQCPACKMLAAVAHEVIKKYEGKVSVQYFFYPLDHTCNPEMQRPLHPLACQAAYLASCLPQKFVSVHDDIFKNQENLSQSWLDDYAKDENVLDCMKSQETKDKVVDLIKQAKPFNISSTPTMLLNGVKVEGVIPINSLIPIFDMLIEKNEKK
ncbi:MAG: thioredoxin domain-containing protein [Bacteriovoracaceae bacterium]|jgi:protein-disulfide isomerase/uncharacterized membrane protein|nr:thioredoxin domain-containing protein [Bacteriovoracaceae bacterium]